MVYNMTQTVLLYVAVEAGTKMQKWFLQNLIALFSMSIGTLIFDIYSIQLVAIFILNVVSRWFEREKTTFIYRHSNNIGIL